MEANKPIVSIIIPTLNEEEFITHLLISIKEQSFADYEVIVADSNSKDKTVEIARSFGCRITDGGRPAKGRNNGAKIAKGKYLLFLDCDVLLSKNFLKNILPEFERRKLGIASCYMNPLSKNFIDRIFHSVANVFIRVNQFINPHAPGFCILAKKDIHDEIHGFDETVVLAEDHDYVKRGKKFGKFRMLKSEKVQVSVRRFYTDGRFNTMWKYLYCELYILFNGSMKKRLYKYNFGHYKRNADAEQQIKD